MKVSEDDPYRPEEPDESDVCPHGKGFDVYCHACDRDDFEDVKAPAKSNVGRARRL